MHHILHKTLFTIIVLFFSFSFIFVFPVLPFNNSIFFFFYIVFFNLSFNIRLFFIIMLHNIFWFFSIGLFTGLIDLIFFLNFNIISIGSRVLWFLNLLSINLSWSHDLNHKFDMLTRVDSGLFFGYFSNWFFFNFTLH